MNVVHLEDAGSVEIRLPGGERLYVMVHERGGFQIVSDRNLLIEPRSDNSIRILPQALSASRPKDKEGEPR